MNAWIKSIQEEIDKLVPEKERLVKMGSSDTNIKAAIEILAQKIAELQAKRYKLERKRNKAVVMNKLDSVLTDSILSVDEQRWDPLQAWNPAQLIPPRQLSREGGGQLHVMWEQHKNPPRPQVKKEPAPPPPKRRSTSQKIGQPGQVKQLSTGSRTVTAPGVKLHQRGTAGQRSEQSTPNLIDFGEPLNPYSLPWTSSSL